METGLDLEACKGGTCDTQCDDEGECDCGCGSGGVCQTCTASGECEEPDVPDVEYDVSERAASLGGPLADPDATTTESNLASEQEETERLTGITDGLAECKVGGTEDRPR